MHILGGRNLAGALLCAAGIAWLTLAPFRIAPNQVQWLDGGGLYFAGGGIASTPRALEPPDAPLEEITLALWLRERKGAKNWGTRFLLSLYDGSASPPLQLSTAEMKLSLLDARRPPRGSPLRMPETLSRDRSHFVAATIDATARCLYVDGVRVDRRASAGARPLGGRLVIGASPQGAQPWWGELEGLAVYRRALPAERLERLAHQARADDVASLAGGEHLVALFPFDEGAGHVARNLAPGPDLRIPTLFAGLPEVLLDLPRPSSLLAGHQTADIARNVALFLPLGFFLGGAVRRARPGRRVWAWLGVAAAGAGFSLAIEALQLFLPTRFPELSDLLGNALGAVLGALARAGTSLRAARGT